MEAETIVREMADEEGMISPDSGTGGSEPSIGDETIGSPSVDIDINIRQDDIRMFETESGRQLLRTSEMSEGMFIEPVPSADGFIAEVVVEPSVEFVETEPASPAEQPSVARGSPVEIRMD